MTKYDFGSEIVSGSTMEWAIKIVQPQSTVLELGPAIGTLTKHLVEDKGCIVDIVEIDYEAGTQAARYARKSCLGEYHGNLEQNDWMSILGNEKQYDYVVILDVMEHVKNPVQLLMHVKELIKDEGEIILSLPNVAHNSVILNLLNNKFEYTDVGLLDDTHVRFFTHKSLDKLLQQCELYVYDKHYKQMLVGENEIKNSYSEVPDSVEQYLRLRDFGDVYQFLYRIKNSPAEQKVDDRVPKPLPYTLYPLELFDQSGSIIKVIHVDPRFVEEKIELNGAKGRLRIDPLNQKCIIKNLIISFICQRDYKKATISLTNGIQLNDEMIFLDDDPQIFVECPQDSGLLYLSYQCTLLSDNDFEIIKSTVIQNIEINSKLKDASDKVSLLQLEEEKKAKVILELQHELLEQKRKYIKLQDDSLRLEKNIHSLQMNLLEKENAVDKLNEQLIQKDAEIKSKCEFTQNIEQELMTTKETLIECEIDSGKLKEQLTLKEAAVKERDELIRSLQQELNVIKQSKIYKFIKKY